MLLIAIIALTTDFPGDDGLFFAGVLAVFLATGAALVMPWNRLPPGLGATIPIVDILAITVMREAHPSAGLGLLWIFPAMWLAGSFGVAGLVSANLGITTIFILQIVVPGREFEYVTVLLPFVIVAVSSSSFVAARRASVQRRLLNRQTEILARALTRARQQEETVTEVLDAVDFGVIRIDGQGRFSVVNEAHGRLQRGPDDDAEIPSRVVVFARDGITPVREEDQPLARALRGEAFADDVMWFGTAGGERRALTVTARRVYDDAGADAGAVVVSRDVTAELTAIHARDDLVASVSHELRTPLTSIVGYLELVLDDDLSPSTRRGLEVAERNANRLLSIVADILAASSSNRSTVELSIAPEPTDVAAVAASSLELHAPRAAERGIRIDASGLEHAVAHVDPSRLRQVLDNLVSNAVKYNRDDGVIEVGTTSDGPHVWIVVRDSGHGISPAEQAQVFDRFFRSDAVRNTSTHGSGLGLSISREIVRSHGGDITVRSDLGSGTTFVVRLPATDEPATNANEWPAT